MTTKEEVEKVWKVYNNFKENAEQFYFPVLLKFDSILEPAYKDLQENWNEEHAEKFVRGIRNSVFTLLKIKEDD